MTRHAIGFDGGLFVIEVQPSWLEKLFGKRARRERYSVNGTIVRAERLGFRRVGLLEEYDVVDEHEAWTRRALYGEKE